MTDQSTLLNLSTHKETDNALIDAGSNNIDSEYIADMVVGEKATYLATGDIIYFPRKGVHGVLRNPANAERHVERGLRPEHVDISWIGSINDYGPTTYDRQTRVTLQTLEKLGERDHIRWIATVGEIGPHTLNKWISDTQYTTQTEPINYVNPAPRIKANSHTFNRIFSLNIANGFLNNPIIDHRKGNVVKAKGIFTANRPDNSISAILTLNSVNARQGFDRETVEITRYASHPDTTTTPNHTATWMLSRVCKWAALEGYETIKTYAGTDGNEGSIYQAANFECTGTANSSGEYNREGRTNQSHLEDLKTYENTLSVDGEKASRSLPRRV